MEYKVGDKFIRRTDTFNINYKIEITAIEPLHVLEIISENNPLIVYFVRCDDHSLDY